METISINEGGGWDKNKRGNGKEREERGRREEMIKL
jgi:hypothetical protein